ncbi:MAG: hypothetical protein U0074_06785 [Kouleothrix sp.]
MARNGRKGEFTRSGAFRQRMRLGKQRWWHVAAHELCSGAAAYAIKAARAAAPEGAGEDAGRQEAVGSVTSCRMIRALVLDDQRLRNYICWFGVRLLSAVGSPFDERAISALGHRSTSEKSNLHLPSLAAQIQPP